MPTRGNNVTNDGEEKRRLIMNAALDAIICIDTGGKITSWNPQAELIFGWKEKEVTGKRLSTLIIPERYRSRHETGMTNYLSTGEGPALNRLLELSALKRNGEEFPVELTIMAIKDGSEEFFCAFIRDITEKKKAADALQAVFNEKNTILESIADAFFAVDKNWLVTYWNKEAEKILHTPKEKIVGKNIWEVFSESTDSLSYKKYHEALATNQVIHFEDHYPQLKKWYEVSAYPSKGGLSVYFKDITERKESEASIKKAYEEKNTVLESIDDGFFAVDNNSLVTYWNKRAEILLNTKRENIIGKNLHEAFARPDSMIFYDNYQKAIREKTTIHFEGFSNRTKKWFSVSAFPSDNGLSVYFRDVTESKEYENKIQESNERYNLISKATNDMVWDWDLATDKVYRNREGWKKIFGTAKEDIEKGHTDDWDDKVHPEDRERVKRFYDLAQQSEKDFFEVECRVLRDDGSYAYVHDRGNIFRDKDGKPVRLIGATQDITERKKAEEILKASEEQYRHLFDNNPAGIVIWDITSLQIIEVNETAVREHGYSREEFLSRTIWDQFPPRHHEQLKIFIEKARAKPDFRSVTTSRYLNKSGEEIFLNIASHRIQYKGRPVILALATNVTEKVLLEKQLEHERVDKQQEITNAVISAQEHERHELGGELHDNINQILAGSLLYLGLAKKELNTEHPYLNEADSLINSAIVEIRKLSHTLIPPSLNESELLPAINDIIDITQKGSGLNITLHAFGIDESSIPDKLKLSIYRIVQEQFNNILKHAQAKKVIVGLIHDKEKLVLSIKDDGIGFDTGKKAEGVGLMNIKTRASLFNGELSINSSPGQGCELRVLFN
jgi:PAS domain S-box-containing protein